MCTKLSRARRLSRGALGDVFGGAWTIRRGCSACRRYLLSIELVVCPVLRRLERPSPGRMVQEPVELRIAFNALQPECTTACFLATRAAAEARKLMPWLPPRHCRWCAPRSAHSTVSDDACRKRLLTGAPTTARPDRK
jgi:hypothetical protein